jgi:hypothetical protein
MPIINVEASMRKGANIFFRINTQLRKLFKKQPASYKDFPVIINNYNRLEYLQQLVSWLERAGMKNIHIIDNASDYAPLIEYYNKLPYTIYRLDKNVGHFSLWQTVLFTRFTGQYYVYTDPDVMPVEDCPLDAVNYFLEILNSYKQVGKVGFGLKIDDLPDHYPLKEKVIRWEKQFWESEIRPGLYDAMIDTTFALYKPGEKGGVTVKSFRTGGVYVTRHLPWYEDPANLSAETKHYMETASGVSSWYAATKGTNKQYQ